MPRVPTTATKTPAKKAAATKKVPAAKKTSRRAKVQVQDEGTMPVSAASEQAFDKVLASVKPSEFDAALQKAIDSGEVNIFGYAERIELDLNEAIDTVLDNNINDLENLRADIERAGAKHIPDVRSFGNTTAGHLLRGIEHGVDYSDLVRLIREMRDGVARRRVEALAKLDK